MKIKGFIDDVSFSTIQKNNKTREIGIKVMHSQLCAVCMGRVECAERMGNVFRGMCSME